MSLASARAFHRYSAPICLVVSVCLSGLEAAADTRGQFDVPARVAVVPLAVDTVASDGASSAAVDHHLVDVTLPISFRVTEGSVKKVEQLEVEILLGQDELQLVDYQPKSAATTDVVGDIEITTTTERGSNTTGGAGASINLPTAVTAQVGPSLNHARTNREVTTKTVRKRPAKRTHIVSGSVQRGRGVFFLIRPAHDFSLEGTHELTLQLSVPADTFRPHLSVRCTAIGEEDWLLFKRTGRLAKFTGKISLEMDPKGESADSHARRPQQPSTGRPCPICDANGTSAAE